VHFITWVNFGVPRGEIDTIHVRQVLDIGQEDPIGPFPLIVKFEKFLHESGGTGVDMHLANMSH
jgi:hypothetical protein